MLLGPNFGLHLEWDSLVKIALSGSYRCFYWLIFFKFLQKIIDDDLMGSATNAETKVFYNKMKGDYYRYLAEVASPHEGMTSFVY